MKCCVRPKGQRQFRLLNFFTRFHRCAESAVRLVQGPWLHGHAVLLALHWRLGCCDCYFLCGGRRRRQSAAVCQTFPRCGDVVFGSILHPSDYKGDLCGVGTESSRPYAAFVLGTSCCKDLTKIPPVADKYGPTYAARVCVASCDETAQDHKGDPTRKIIRPYISTERVLSLPSFVFPHCYIHFS